MMHCISIRYEDKDCILVVGNNLPPHIWNGEHMRRLYPIPIELGEIEMRGNGPNLQYTFRAPAPTPGFIAGEFKATDKGLRTLVQNLIKSVDNREAIPTAQSIHIHRSVIDGFRTWLHENEEKQDKRSANEMEYYRKLMEEDDE